MYIRMFVPGNDRVNIVFITVYISIFIAKTDNSPTNVCALKIWGEIPLCRIELLMVKHIQHTNTYTLTCLY